MRFHISFLLLILVLGTGCNIRTGSGTKASETRTTPAFTGVHVHGSKDVVILVGGEQTVTVETDDNLLEIVTTEVVGDTLVIRSTESHSTRLGVKVKIGVPTLAAVTVSGSGEVHAQGVKATTFKAKVNGSGAVVATGSADRLDIVVSGSGNVDLSELSAQNVEASVDGSGDIQVHCTGKLKAEVTGSGKIEYRGSPNVEHEIYGTGHVSHVK